MNNKFKLVSSAINMNEMAIKDPMIARYLKNRPDLLKKVTAQVAKKGQVVSHLGKQLVA